MSLDILIADQDVELAQLYCRYLDDHGWTAQPATSGLEILETAKHFKPGVLVLDHELPWGDGKRVLARLSDDNIALPVILTTWKASPDFADPRAASPVVLCLRKFFPLSMLLDGIRFARRNKQPGKNSCVSDDVYRQGGSTWNANK